MAGLLRHILKAEQSFISDFFRVPPPPFAFCASGGMPFGYAKVFFLTGKFLLFCLILFSHSLFANPIMCTVATSFLAAPGIPFGQGNLVGAHAPTNPAPAPGLPTDWWWEWNVNTASHSFRVRGRSACVTGDIADGRCQCRIYDMGMEKPYSTGWVTTAGTTANQPVYIRSTIYATHAICMQNCPTWCADHLRQGNIANAITPVANRHRIVFETTCPPGFVRSHSNFSPGSASASITDARGTGTITCSTN